MSTSRTLRNVSSNYLTYTLNIAIVFFLTPVLLRGLGKEDFALFVVVQSLYALLGWLDLGLLVGLIRFVTAARERGEDAAIQGTVSTAFYGLGALGLLVSGLLWVCAGPLARMFDLPADASSLTAQALRIGSVGLALDLGSFVLTSYLQAHHEFHLPNITETAVRLLRAGAMALLVWQGYGLVAIAAVFPLAAAARLAGNLVMSRLSSHPFLPRLGEIRFRLLRGLGRFSLLTFLDDNVNLAFLQADVLLGARVLALPQLALVGAVRPLSGLLPQISRQALTVALPMVVAAEVREQHEARDRFLTITTRNWLLVSGVIAAGVWIWARPLLGLWLGAEMSAAAEVLRILLLAALAASFVYIPSTLLYGMGRVGYCAIVTLSTTALGVGLAAWGGSRFGPVGLAWGLVAAQTLTVLLLYGGAHYWSGIRSATVFRRAVLPTAPAIAAAIAISWLMFRTVPHTWAGMAVAGILAAAAAFGLFLAQMKRRERSWRATVRSLIMEI
jgi:O-antigen/teichoic acid export membrane protein